MTEKESPTIFISYATPDRDRVLPYYENLNRSGFNVWMDCQSIRAGQNWDFEIKRALDKSTFVIAFISKNSYERRGYVQRELKIALDKLSEKLVDDIYIIPVILDDGIDIPDQLKSVQCISASNTDCYNKIGDAITFQLGRLGIAQQKTQRNEELYWTSESIQESWDGLPGYEVDVQVINFASEKYPHVSQIGAFLRGHFLKSLFTYRHAKLKQMPTAFNYAQDRFRRINTLDAHCGEPVIKGRVLTIQYTIHWYGAGAAHPNHHFNTFCFVLDPLTLIQDLASIFTAPTQALPIIQEEVRLQLKSTLYGADADLDEHSSKWLHDGTAKWDDYSAFVFGPDDLQFLFAPYHVASYAQGSHTARISYLKLAALIRPEIKSALGIEYLEFQAEFLKAPKPS